MHVTDKKWKTADGKKMRIKDMSTHHIVNTIRYINGKSDNSHTCHLSSKSIEKYNLAMYKALNIRRETNAIKQVASFMKTTPKLYQIY